MVRYHVNGVMSHTSPPITPGPAYNGYQATTSRFLCIEITDSKVKKFGYYEYPLAMSSFFCIFLLVFSGTQGTLEYLSI